MTFEGQLLLLCVCLCVMEKLMNALKGIIEQIYNCCGASNGTQSVFLISYCCVCGARGKSSLFARFLSSHTAPTHVTTHLVISANDFSRMTSFFRKSPFVTSDFALSDINMQRKPLLSANTPKSCSRSRVLASCPVSGYRLPPAHPIYINNNSFGTI